MTNWPAQNSGAALPQADMPQPESWHTIGAAGEPAFQNSWVAYGGGTVTPAFRRDQWGRVFLKGQIKSGTLNVAAFTLPSGYRPVLQVLCAVDNGWAAGRVDVQPDGQVMIYCATSGVVDLHPVVFDTA